MGCALHQSQQLQIIRRSAQAQSRLGWVTQLNGFMHHRSTLFCVNSLLQLLYIATGVYKVYFIQAPILTSYAMLRNLFLVDHQHIF